MAKQILTESEIKKIVEENKQFLAKSNNQYLRYLIKKPDVTIEIYTTNSIVYRYKNTNFKPTKATKTTIKFSDQIGSDETGTGDLFGPIVFAAAMLNDEIIAKLKTTSSYSLINDSKKISDQQIVEIVNEINEIVPHVKYIIEPKQFNNLTPRYNLNELKTIGHLAVLNKIYKQYQLPVYVDAFCTIKNWYGYINNHNLNQDFSAQELTFETKAESKYAAVALASIYARYHLINWFKDAEQKLNFELPKGAGAPTIEAFKNLKDIHDMSEYAKLSWKSIQDIT